MVATQPLRRPAVRPARSAQPRQANLRVVRPDHRIRVVGMVGTSVAVTLFVVLFVVVVARRQRPKLSVRVAIFNALLFLSTVRLRRVGL